MDHKRTTSSFRQTDRQTERERERERESLLWGRQVNPQNTHQEHLSHAVGKTALSFKTLAFVVVVVVVGRSRNSRPT